MTPTFYDGLIEWQDEQGTLVFDFTPSERAFSAGPLVTVTQSGNVRLFSLPEGDELVCSPTVADKLHLRYGGHEEVWSLLEGRGCVVAPDTLFGRPVTWVEDFGPWDGVAGSVLHLGGLDEELEDLAGGAAIHASLTQGVWAQRWNLGQDATRGWTLTFELDGSHYSVSMAHGDVVPNVRRDDDGLGWVNWGSEQQGWLRQERERYARDVDAGRWFVARGNRESYDGYLFLPARAFILGVWESAPLGDLHLFWKDGWFWCAYEGGRQDLSHREEA